MKIKTLNVGYIIDQTPLKQKILNWKQFQNEKSFIQLEGE